MKIIFMGTPEFSVGTLEALLKAGHEVVLAVTQPDKPKGRGKEMQHPPVKAAALKYGIDVYQPVRVRRPECVEELRKYNADIMVVVAFGQILPKEILEMTMYGCINVHASLLPKYRGAAPIQWSIIEGEEVTGVTTMQMDEGLDTGDMLLKTVVPIEATETGGSLHDKLAKAGAELCVETLEALKDGTVEPKKQGETPTAYAKMLTKNLGDIDWTQPADQIEHLIRGLTPWPCVYTHWGDKVMKIWSAKVIPLSSDAKPGTVLENGRDAIIVQTGKDALEILELQLPGKKRMDAAAFLRGYHIEKGTVFVNGQS